MSDDEEIKSLEVMYNELKKYPLKTQRRMSRWLTNRTTWDRIKSLAEDPLGIASIVEQTEDSTNAS